MAYFLEPVLQHHDRSRFEIFCYSDVRVPDAVTERLKGRVEHWRDIAGKDDEEVCAQIRADGIDLLIDLAGHTANHRLGVFARQAAPVQATWLGYPNTTGLAAMDFRLTDTISDPPGVTDRWNTERLVRLPGPFSCYRPPADAPAVQGPPSAARGWVTFGCFNHLAKITPPVVAAWSRILARVRGSKLLLKTRGLDEATRRSVRERFAAHGIDPARIEINADSLSVRDHLALYGGVDIALDAFPYNGATTTCEALWMGVPVIVLAGETHVSRVGASLLTHAGMPEWIAGDTDAYVDRAATLAADAGALAEVRRNLRGRLAASPICDEIRFTAALEGAFSQLTHSEPLPAKVADRQAVRGVI